MRHEGRANTILGRLFQDLYTSMQNDIDTVGISNREAAEMIGMKPSTLHHFLYKTQRPQKKTLKKISSAAIWSRNTRDIIYKIERFVPDLSTGAINADTKSHSDVFRISAPETLSDRHDIQIAKKK